MNAIDAAAPQPSVLDDLIRQAINDAGGWLGFDHFMALALYAPDLGYYSNQRRKFGLMPGRPSGQGAGSDFVTAPEMSPLFGRALAVQVRQALAASATDEVWEFGAGTGALAEQILLALEASGAPPLQRYNIVDLSGSLRARQAERLSAWGDKVRWLDQLPETFEGVVLGNEVLDAMPVQLLAFDGRAWAERGVAIDARSDAFVFADKPSALRPPWAEAMQCLPDVVTEIHPQAEAFVCTLAAGLRRGAVFLIDYGFPEAEYYHPQRSGGTLMCHHEHRADANPLVLLGQKDITAHVNFSAIALAGQDAGLQVLGYTNQANFLFNCGLVGLLETASLAERVMAHKLIAEHEMGELFKVIGFATGDGFDAIGFSTGDRSHSL
jgi:SAM-dependent MidA family methyltransferase